MLGITLLVKADPIVETRWAKFKHLLSVAFLMGMLLLGAGLLMAIAWGLPIFLMWQGGWWAMLGLGFWMLFSMTGKMLDKMIS